MRVGAEGDDGSGIRLGVAAGAATLHMDASSISLPATQPWGLKRGILVNTQGQRFINEDAYYGRLGEWALFHHGGRAWLVTDDAIFEKPELPARDQSPSARPRPSWRGSSASSARQPRDHARALQPPRRAGRGSPSSTSCPST